jgi:hypothetical protein
MEAACCCFFFADRVIRNMAPMSTMNGRRVTGLTGRDFLLRPHEVSGLLDGGMYAVDKGGIGGV